MPSRAQLRIVSGLALAAPLTALTFAAAGTANAEETPVPAPSGSASPAPSTSAGPVPNAPADTPGDTRLTDVQLYDPRPGDPGLIRVNIAGAKPGITYKLSFAAPARLNVTGARSLGVPRDEQKVTFQTTGDTTHGSVTFTAGAKISSGVVFVYLTPTDGPKATVTVSASVETPGTPDSDPSNNSGTSSGQVSGAASLKGRVWTDANKNGLRDSGEKGAKGARVTVIPKDSETEAPKPAVITASGSYDFPHLPDGQYAIVVTLPDGGWSFTRPNAGDDSSDSDVQADTGKRTARTNVVIKDSKAVTTDAGVVSTATTPAPSSSASASPVPSGAHPIPSASAAAASGSLPKTGASVGGAIGAGFALVGAGVAAVLVTRRRRAKQA